MEPRREVLFLRYIDQIRIKQLRHQLGLMMTEEEFAADLYVLLVGITMFRRPRMSSILLRQSLRSVRVCTRWDIELTSISVEAKFHPCKILRAPTTHPV